jgi:hypothetical protein
MISLPSEIRETKKNAHEFYGTTTKQLHIKFASFFDVVSLCFFFSALFLLLSFLTICKEKSYKLWMILNFSEPICRNKHEFAVKLFRQCSSHENDTL